MSVICINAASTASFSSFWLPLILAVLVAVLVEFAIVIAFLKRKDKKTSQTVLNAERQSPSEEKSAFDKELSDDREEAIEEVSEQPTEDTIKQSTEEVSEETIEETVEAVSDELEPISDEAEQSDLVKEDEPTDSVEEDEDDDELPNRAVLDEDALEDAKELERLIHPDESLDEFSQNTDSDETVVIDETADTNEPLVDATNEPNASFISDEPQDFVDEDDQSYISALSDGANLIDDEGAMGGRLFFGGKEITVRYLRSFTAKLSQSNDLVKERYSALKNELLSYKKAKARISWYAESFRLGKPTVAKITVRGKTLTLYLALSPDKLQGTKYHYKDVGGVKKYAQVPTCLKIKSNRAVRWAKELISLMAEENGFTRFDASEVDYYPEYRTTKELVMANLIKLQGINALNEYEKLQRADDTDTSSADYIENEPTFEAPVTDDSQPLQAVENIYIAETHEDIPMAIIMECALTEDGTVEIKETEEPEEPEEQPVPDVEPEIEEVYEPLAERDFQIVHEVSVTRADKDMTNEKAVSLIEEVKVVKQKADKQGAKGIINIDTLSQNYKAGETVTLDDLKRKKLLPKKIGYLKVLGRGIINKPLIVEADEFSINAAKMILLTGGRVVRDL